jgi:hypothetical protein
MLAKSLPHRAAGGVAGGGFENDAAERAEGGGGRKPRRRGPRAARAGRAAAPPRQREEEEVGQAQAHVQEQPDEDLRATGVAATSGRGLGEEEIARMDRAGEEEDAGHGRQPERERIGRSRPPIHHAEKGGHGGRPTVRIFSVTLMRG